MELPVAENIAFHFRTTHFIEHIMCAPFLETLIVIVLRILGFPMKTVPPSTD